MKIRNCKAVLRRIWVPFGAPNLGLIHETDKQLAGLNRIPVGKEAFFGSRYYQFGAGFWVVRTNCEAEQYSFQTKKLPPRRHREMRKTLNLVSFRKRAVGKEKMNVADEFSREDRWKTIIVPALRNVSITVLERMCRPHYCRTSIIAARAGRIIPLPHNQHLLISVLKKLGCL